MESLSAVCDCQTSDDFGRYGAGERADVYGYDAGDYHRKAVGLDTGLYPGLWIAGSGRCEVLHAGFGGFHVDFPREPVHLSLPGSGLWPHGSLDRHVHRLDSQSCDFHPPFLFRKVEAVSGGAVKDNRSVTPVSALPALPHEEHFETYSRTERFLDGAFKIQGKIGTDADFKRHVHGCTLTLTRTVSHAFLLHLENSSPNVVPKCSSCDRAGRAETGVAELLSVNSEFVIRSLTSISGSRIMFHRRLFIIANKMKEEITE